MSVEARKLQAPDRVPAGTGRVRAVIENVRPQVDGGRFPIKRIVGEAVRVTAEVFADGHDCVVVQLLHRHDGDSRWHAAFMQGLGNDRWQATFAPAALGIARYRVRAWVDHFMTWRRDLQKRHAAGQDLGVEWLRGAALVEAAARHSGSARLAAFAARLCDAGAPTEKRLELAAHPALAALMQTHPDPALVALSDSLEVMVESPRARFSAWYELFPRSTSPDPGRHGTFADLRTRLSYVADMGFDVLYLPPIHPIGITARKGRNNRVQAAPGDPGSPWAIGSAAGGHKAVHPELGTLEDLRAIVSDARALGLEVALDIAFQCSPDHPYVHEHPEWFRKRPDGSIQYAENPPKTYQDIYPFDFESEAWPALWDELLEVVRFWIGQGIRIFRVDNPHTKPFHFWEWLIRTIKQQHPDVIFLSEAFTRPNVMRRLAKTGFSQSYTYFTWRTTKHELVEYLTELAQHDSREYFRPNLWPNTPDILPENLQFTGRTGFMLRVTLAATLGANYGIYGPAFELLEDRAREPGSEEYLDSEKYQQRTWDLDRADSLRAYLAHLNRIRREHPALQADWSLHFHASDNDALLCYSKCTTAGDDCVLCVANLDVHHSQSGWVTLDLDRLGIDAAQPFQVHDLLSSARFLWRGARNFVVLDPSQGPAHLFLLRRQRRSEHDFDYFL
ncbi:MAG: alpha-1,4-glucan--maltose-1-phosphate maltosyltransferase [Gammaproteobacteria bacterium]|nr:alpha-1,4-glucan--maltose-1-phosphate maltosyltransferase [Gammaproteobacteria bacterium]